MKRYKFAALILALSATLAGCVTVEDFLENLGLKKSENIQTVYLDSIRRNYEITGTANVRSAPNFNAEVLGTLSYGQRFYALGRAGEWIAIGDNNGSVLGYVHASLTREAGTVQKRTRKVSKNTQNSSTRTESTKSEKETQTNAQSSGGIDLDDIPAKETSPATKSSTPSPEKAAPSKSGGVDLDSL